MVDTLEMAKKLESAGFERRQAEAVATAVAGGASERDTQLDDIKGSIQDVRTALREEIQTVRTELRDEIQAVRADIQGIRTELARIETLIAKSRTEQIIWTVGALGVMAALLRLFP